MERSIVENPGFVPDGSGKKFETREFLAPIFPIGKKRLKWRGFNHTEEIAKVLSAALSIPIHTDLLQRTKNTPPQIALTKEERIRNMQDVFQVQNREQLQGKKILLLDDVFTTGATLQEAARALKKAGAHQVFGIVVARGS